MREHPEISERDVGIIAEQLPDARRILDIGCGAGNFLATCRERLGGGVGIDPSPASARLCRAQGLPVLLADGSALPFASGSLEVVRAKEIIEHILDLRPFMREVYRVLQPGGLFLSQTPTQFSILYPIGINFYDDYTHIRPLTRMGLRRLFADANLETVYVYGHTAGRNAIERLLGRVLGRTFPYVWVALARKPAAS
jgi:SAM-dependent methyltransferase